MAIINVSELNPEIREMKTYSDSETGCYSYDDQQAFESCKQAYYLKEQNEILSQQENVPVLEQNNNIDQEDIELMKSQIETMQQEIELQQKEITTAKTQQDVQVPQKDNIFFAESQGAIVLSLLVISVVGFTIGILFAKKIMNR